MPAPRPHTVLAGCLTGTLCLMAAGRAAAGVPDCFADEVVVFQGGYTPPGAGQRVAELPGIVTGPPGDSFPVTGSVSTVSIGRGGAILLAFTDNVIVDGPGFDFIVFENAFFKSTVPADPNQTWEVFAEPATVAVSDDGVQFFTFPYDPAALARVGPDGTSSADLPQLRGLAGITPTFTGNWTLPDDPDTWDPVGAGGVSGAGGDGFDLAVVGLTRARYVLITDLNLGTGHAGPAEGFDLDAVIAVNSEPVAAWPDGDGDGLSDDIEGFDLGSDPLDPDTDGDGIPDGIEAARCRSPVAPGDAPWFLPRPDLRMLHDRATGNTHGRWSFISSSARYDLVRGAISASTPAPGDPVVCLEDNSFNLTSADRPDGAVPAPGTAFFYLVRVSGAPGGTYGRASGGAPRTFVQGDCAP